MENKEFQIIPLQERHLLVVILSSEMTSHYWKELQAELANCNIADAEVYFDFLYRNGLKNRFFKSELKGITLIANSLKKCEAPQEYIKVADTFFASHSKWIDSSVLSSFQKVFYKRRITNEQSLTITL
ncbi:type II toxin-antitoxin system RnlB family antitoxin [Parabacteroides goldsteinii]|mgnify:FL=1|jgi:L-rhamnose mutarotase|uniref:type II toxin-antitoxin system RnlB family antitoxin n=1 Tax=Parabacteroides goldsteinii TaxID=328812 RepID=UPI00189B8B0F|nr:type II toxin-antitoxin system RnlB family antitoxin [Parabacteroides goldsteinii]